MNVPVRRVTWPRTVRIIRSIHPPIDLFEDIADPADWEALASAEAKFNPRIRDSIGDLSKVPVERRVTGPGASWVMAPFVHCSPLRPGRFSDGSFGLYYAGDRTEVAIAETIHHHARFMLATAQPRGWTSQFREIVLEVDAELHDVRSLGAEAAPVLDPADYVASQVLGIGLRALGSSGIAYPSVRCPGGECVGLFYPDGAGHPVQGRHLDYHWNGERVDLYRDRSAGEVFRIV